MTEKSTINYRSQWAGDSENPAKWIYAKNTPEHQSERRTWIEQDSNPVSRCDVSWALTGTQERLQDSKSGGTADNMFVLNNCFQDEWYRYN